MPPDARLPEIETDEALLNRRRADFAKEFLHMSKEPDFLGEMKGAVGLRPKRIVARHSPKGIDLGKFPVGKAEGQGANVIFPVLPTEEGFIPGSKLVESALAPDDTGSLPGDIQGEKTVQIGFVIGDVPKDIAVPRLVLKQTCAPNREGEVGLVFHEGEAGFQAMVGEGVVGIEEDEIASDA